MTSLVATTNPMPVPATSLTSRSIGFYGQKSEMTSSFLLVVIVSSSSLGSASAECTGGNSVLSVPSSGPTVCLPLDDYVQLQKDASNDGESVSYYRRLIRLKEV